MRVPYPDYLNEMAQLVAQCDFDNISDPNNRARIIELCIMADQAEWLYEIDDDLRPVREWFQSSDEYRRF